VLEEVFIHHGASIGFWRGVSTKYMFYTITLYLFISAIWSISILLQDVKLLVEDIGELKPTIFCAVPRVLGRIYGGIYTAIWLNIIFTIPSSCNIQIFVTETLIQKLMFYFSDSGLQDKITAGGFLKKTLFNVAYK
jgi:long-chain acyl-CoA synthetase